MTSRDSRRSVTGALVGIASGVLIIGLIFMVVQIFVLTNSIRAQQKINTQTNELTLSCVTPKEPCFEMNEDRAATMVTDVRRISVYAAACVDLDGVQGAIEIEACVNRLLRKYIRANP